MNLQRLRTILGARLTSGFRAAATALAFPCSCVEKRTRTSLPHLGPRFGIAQIFKNFGGGIASERSGAKCSRLRLLVLRPGQANAKLADCVAEKPEGCRRSVSCSLFSGPWGGIG